MYKSVVACLCAMAANLLASSGGLAQVTSINVTADPVLEIQSDFRSFRTVIPVQVEVEANSSFAVTVSAPTPSGFTEPSGTPLRSIVTYGGVEQSSDANGAVNFIVMDTANTVVFDVGIETGPRPQPYPAGDYTYNVTLTIVAP